MCIRDRLQLATDIGLTTGTSTAPTPVSASITTTAGAGNYNLVTLTDATYATANATVTAKMVTGGTATTVEKVEVSGANVVLTTTSAHNANGPVSYTHLDVYKRQNPTTTEPLLSGVVRNI